MTDYKLKNLVATDAIWDAAGDFAVGTGANTAGKLPLGLAALPVINLKPVVNAAANKLDVFSKSGGAFPDATNYITVSIPDVAGVTTRQRAGEVASGTGQVILADAANYWSKGSLAAEIKTAYLYAIWSTADGGIVWALNGYSGFTRCPASVTATDDDYMHLEASSSYTPVITDYCVAVAKIRYEYDTGDAPDHTIQATALNAPQVCWNPKSDYGYQSNLATTVTQASNIAEYSAVSVVVKQSGKYDILGKSFGLGVTTYGTVWAYIKTGSATYGSAVYKSSSLMDMPANSNGTAVAFTNVYLNAGDTIHLGVTVNAAGGNRILRGDNTNVGATSLIFNRAD